MLMCTLPLLTTIILLFWHRSGRSLYYISPVLLSVAALESLHWLRLVDLGQVLLVVSNFCNIDYLNITWELLFSNFTLISVFCVLTLSVLIQTYSLSYMRVNVDLIFFIALMTFFTFCMVLLIFSNSTVLLLLGWEGVGLLSYLLINFWGLRIESNKASLKAIFINKIGDLFLMLSIIIIFNCLLSTNILVIGALVPYLEYELIGNALPLIVVLSLLLFVAGSVKSAQLVFAVWLPDAMEGPTPVSSLIHSATMVAAGLFLILKFQAVFNYSTIVLPVILYTGILTSLLVSSDSLCMFDHKSILAGSTCEQLALMFTMYGLNASDVAFFHFCTHAVYKSLLFLSLGALIHQTGEQESRLMLVTAGSNPVSLVCYQTGLISLIGFPGSISHYSKSVALTTVYTYSFIYDTLIYTLVQGTQTVSSLLNILGAVALFYSTQLSDGRKTQGRGRWLFTSSLIKLPILILSLASLMGGLIVLNAYLYNTLNADLKSSSISSYLATVTPPTIWLSWGGVYLLLLSTFVYFKLSKFYVAPYVSRKFAWAWVEIASTAYIDQWWSLSSLIYLKLSYDLGFVALNGSLFSLSYYLRFLLFYNTFIHKLYSNASLMWLVMIQSTLLWLIWVQIS